MNQPEVLKQLASRLYQLRDTGRIIRFVQVGIGDPSELGSWKPVPKHCHDNVDTWVSRSPEYSAVRGWVIFDQSRNPLVPRPRVRFAAHSVIAAPNGTLLDITPADLSQPYPFICHPGTTEEFDQLRHEFQIMFVDHYLDGGTVS
ncbi:MAG: hypothetical protein E5X76_31980 [Mesorhizobium sp.]|nr:MAG: hypothetical protein E5X76_31980 [Mesorhizobium sp.]